MKKSENIDNMKDVMMMLMLMGRPQPFENLKRITTVKGNYNTIKPNILKMHIGEIMIVYKENDKYVTTFYLAKNPFYVIVDYMLDICDKALFDHMHKNNTFKIQKQTIYTIIRRKLLNVDCVYSIGKTEEGDLKIYFEMKSDKIADETLSLMEAIRKRLKYTRQQEQASALS